MRLWVVMLLVMLVIIAGGIFLERSILITTDSISRSLDAIEDYVSNGQWSEAEELCRKIDQDWARQTEVWKPFLHNEELDVVALDVARLLSLLENREKANALLKISVIKVQVVQLHHQEILTLQNIF